MRAFTEHIKRKTSVLDGAWKFIADPQKDGESLGYNSEIPEGAVTVTVPSCWNTYLGMLEYCGVAWYYREFYSAGGYVRLIFDGAMTSAEVFVDGEHCASHYGGFTAFSAELSDLKEGWHLIAVRIDNSFDKESIPAKIVDWYHYGGIIRSVSIEYPVGISALSCRFDYKLDLSEKSALANLTVRLKNCSADSLRSSLVAKLDGEALAQSLQELDAWEEREVSFEGIKLSSLDLWDTENPRLYSLSVETDTDDLYDRVGFREIKAEAGGIWLNGRELELRGFCRHEEHPDFGFAFPPSLMKRDIDIITETGANSIRGSHYPNSKYFMDLIDEAGILFWCEIPIWGHGYTAEALEQPLFIERGRTMLGEMVEQYFNHPSIIIWGIHNELPTEKESARRLSEHYYGYVKGIGGNRLVTFASDRPLTDVCFEFCDVISLNQYHGWYGGSMNVWADVIEKIRQRRAELGMENKPVIMSEFGAAAIYGHHTFDGIRWTEEYQAKLLEHVLGVLMADDMVRGYFVWQFCDIRTCEEMGLNRARGFNNKGVVNEYRRPKLSYSSIKKAYKR